MGEILTGLEFEHLIALAQARVVALADARDVYVSHLRQAHECGNDWALNDWVSGFERVVQAEAEEEIDGD